uniref:Uncharacterized protein n=1 Tax=Hucho hucho TaxID=62062 RepID=A0A4W5N1X6_9TELE
MKHFSQTALPYQLMCRYLIRTKKQDQLRSRVKELCDHKASDNIIKLYCQHNIVPAMQETCGRVMPGEERPPVERERCPSCPTGYGYETHPPPHSVFTYQRKCVILHFTSPLLLIGINSYVNCLSSTEES